MPSLLCFTGLLLFVVGLATGFAIPRFRAPRIGLSAHLTATQCGVALIAFGLLWPKIAFRPGWSEPLANTVWLSFFLLWAGMTLAAAWGAGGLLPIAGKGHEAARWQDQTARALIGIGSLGSLAAPVAILVQWRWIG